MRGSGADVGQWPPPGPGGPNLSQLPAAHDGPGLAQSRLGHAQRVGARLHRAGRPAAHARVGDPRRGGGVVHSVRRVVDRALSRAGPHAGGLLLQPAGGRSPRSHRSAATDMIPGAVPLLSVRDLSVEFRTRAGVIHALDRVSFEVARGETVGVVGESGSGKSVTAFALLRILDPAARITGGTAVFGGLDLLAARESELQLQRGRELSMIFQNPRTALNPIRPVGRQIEDVLLRHANIPRGDARKRA